MAKSLKSQSEKGQVAVEYVLLLITGVVIWLLIVNTLVSRSPDSPGMIVRKWHEIVQWIGQDKIEP
jgi:hypothetical protein